MWGRVSPRPFTGRFNTEETLVVTYKVCGNCDHPTHSGQCPRLKCPCTQFKPKEVRS